MPINQLLQAGEFLWLSQNHNLVPAGVEILADTETPVSLLRKFIDRQDALFLLESAHALPYAMKAASQLPSDSSILVNLSGRGDKDLGIIEAGETLK